MNSVTANSQVRVMYDIPTMPTNGGFSSTIINGIRFNSTSGLTNDGIAWSTDAFIFRSAATTIKMAGASDGTTAVNLTVTGTVQADVSVTME